MAVIALGNTTPETNILHETITADSLQAMRHPFSNLKKDRMGFPDLPQGVCLDMAEDRFRDHFFYTAEGVGTICKNADNPKDSASCTAVPIFTKHPAQGPKC